MRAGLSLRSSLRRRALGLALAAGSVVVFAPAAQAHFILKSPPSWMSQDSLGAPEKLGPCGDEGGGTPTGTVTAYQAGQKLTVTIDEVIFHPGHYRIALAVHDRSELPAEPPVTAGPTLACGSVPVASPPVFPVLADGVFEHTQPFTGPQSIALTLPADVTCTKCTLQVIEFMSDHGLNNPGGCFYHHCADLAIQSGPVDAGAEDGAAPAADGGAAASDGGGGQATASSGTSGCTVSPGRRASAGLLVPLLALAALARRRRR